MSSRIQLLDKMLINPGIVTSQEASLPVLLIGRRFVAISIPRTERESNPILLDCVTHYTIQIKLLFVVTFLLDLIHRNHKSIMELSYPMQVRIFLC